MPHLVDLLSSQCHVGAMMASADDIRLGSSSHLSLQQSWTVVCYHLSDTLSIQHGCQRHAGTRWWCPISPLPAQIRSSGTDWDVRLLTHSSAYCWFAYSIVKVTGLMLTWHWNSFIFLFLLSLVLLFIHPDLTYWLAENSGVHIL